MRHALLADSAGINKALAVEAAIRDIYRHEEVTNLHARGFSATILLDPSASDASFDIQRLFDFTASEVFLHTVLTSPHLNHAAVCRGLLSDHGHLGILSLEGPNRNPRLDDLQALLYAEYGRRPAVEAWLRRENVRAATDNPLVSVGVGCNSETTVLADYTISTHAAYFAEVLKHSMTAAARPAHGQIFLSRLSFDGGFPSVSTERLVVEPLTVIPAVNDATWQVRIVQAVLQRIREELNRASPQETGGVFIGRASFKSKTIHVVDLVLAPPDSRANQVFFFRGIQDLPEQVAAVTEATGGQLGYIGEWHTHPQGPECMSQTDAEAVQRFKQEFESLNSPLPVFLLIATPTTFLPFVY